jgi:hypothetical protein
MRVLDLIGLLDPEVTPEKSKLHLATWNGSDDPVDVYQAGKFDMTGSVGKPGGISNASLLLP